MRSGVKLTTSEPVPSGVMRRKPVATRLSMISCVMTGAFS